MLVKVIRILERLGFHLVFRCESLFAWFSGVRACLYLVFRCESLFGGSLAYIRDMELGQWIKDIFFEEGEYVRHKDVKFTL